MGYVYVRLCVWHTSVRSVYMCVWCLRVWYVCTCGVCVGALTEWWLGRYARRTNLSPSLRDFVSTVRVGVTLFGLGGQVRLVVPL